MPVLARPSLTKRFILGSFFKLTHYRPLTSRTNWEQCSSYVPISGGGHVEDIRGRSCGAGVDHAFRRDGRGVGAVDPPALRWPQRCAPSGGRLGEKRDRGCNCAPPAWTSRTPGVTIEGRVGPRGGPRPLKPQ